jgi:hypothetical protein
VTTLSIGRAPTTKSADQLRAERRDRRAARGRTVDVVLELAQFAVLVVLGSLLLFGSGPFEGTRLLLFGG